jgi:GT2 family glycosyltransferase
MRLTADANPEFTMFGGVIRPRWEVPPEPWLLAWVPLSPTFALTDPAWSEGPIKSDLVFSPNMAIRSEVFRDGYRFDESIGPRQGEYPMGSETELTRRLSRAGRRAWHTPRSVVEHIIRASQMEREWVLARAVRYGRGQYRLSGGNGGERASAFGVPIRLLAGVIVQAGWAACMALAGDREARFHRLWSRNYFLGGIREALAIRRERRQTHASAAPGHLPVAGRGRSS